MTLCAPGAPQGTTTCPRACSSCLAPSPPPLAVSPSVHAGHAAPAPCSRLGQGGAATGREEQSAIGHVPCLCPSWGGRLLTGLRAVSQ